MSEPRAKRNRLKRLVRRLRVLEREWPDGFYLWSASGTLHLMRGHVGGADAVGENGGRKPEDVVETFGGIPNDGGDW